MNGFPLDTTTPLKIGGPFFGCIIEDDVFPLNVSTTEISNVEWGFCPLPFGTCKFTSVFSRTVTESDDDSI